MYAKLLRSSIEELEVEIEDNDIVIEQLREEVERIDIEIQILIEKKIMLNNRIDVLRAVTGLCDELIQEKQREEAQ